MKSMIKCAMPGIAGALLLSSAVVLTSCEDFFEQESEYVIYEDDHSLSSAVDSVYSVTGILDKMQELSDRTILLGEARADLVDVTDAAHADLRQLALFKMDSDNKYNNPRDYYTVINNCNYFIAKADTSSRNGNNEQVLLKEYAAVKGYRAWTYLQLVLNYGHVPFVTTPILTQEEAEADYPVKDLKGVCDWLINDIQGLVDVEHPHYGEIRNTDSQFFYFPIRLLLGELCLWAGYDEYAALYYYSYIMSRGNGVYPVTNACAIWLPKTSSVYEVGTWNYQNLYTGSESYNSSSELITMIPGDSIPSEGNFSELRGLFNTLDNRGNFNETTGGKVSLIPSESLKGLSQGRAYCHVTNAVPAKVMCPFYVDDSNKWGDLRLPTNVSTGSVVNNGERFDGQSVLKFQTRNVHIYRRMMVYLRLAEALNRAGYPKFAYHILATGVNDEILEDSIIPHYSEEQASFLRLFSFPKAYYPLRTVEMVYNNSVPANTMGIHDRGCGFTAHNEIYRNRMWEGCTADMSPEDSLRYQIENVEDMLMDECALELCFEGTRFYDLMRVAMRRGDPAYLADRIYLRKWKGIAEYDELDDEKKRERENSIASMKSQIGVDLYNQDNWYLDWNGKIGITLPATGEEE